MVEPEGLCSRTVCGCRLTLATRGGALYVRIGDSTRWRLLWSALQTKLASAPRNGLEGDTHPPLSTPGTTS